MKLESERKKEKQKQGKEKQKQGKKKEKKGRKDERANKLGELLKTVVLAVFHLIPKQKAWLATTVCRRAYEVSVLHTRS
jgi:ribosomal protein S25